MLNKGTTSAGNPANEMLAANLAHEIRNPLALIRANLQYVELCDAGGGHKKYYDVIYREIDRINDILLSYMDSVGLERLILKRFNVCELIGEIEQMFRHTLKRSNISLNITVIDSGMEVKADYNKLKQVLINVIQNSKEAIEATGKEKGLIETVVYMTDGYANICVTDNGTGMSEEDLQRVGIPFFTKKDKGCGLGISISREIMKRHNGALTYRAAEAAGTSAQISLPLYNGI